MVRVKLVAISIPLNLSDPRRLVALAVKVSQGKLGDREPEYYLNTYPLKKVSEWVRKAKDFPSVLEHIVFTFLIEDVSRVFTHQIVRHRIASYTQESLRYSEGYAKKCVEAAKEELARIMNINVLSQNPAVILEAFTSLASDASVVEVASQCFVIPEELSDAEKAIIARNYLQNLVIYYELLNRGVDKEIARYVLPQAIKTRIMITMNLRELIHVARLRLSPKAQPETRRAVEEMVREVERFVPEIRELIEGIENG